MTKDVITLLDAALKLERMATLVLVAIGGSLVYVIAYRIPPMIANTLESVSKSLEKISVTLAELVVTSTRICADTNSHAAGLSLHHQNATEIRTILDSVSEKVDESNKTLDRIENTLSNRPCIK